MITGLDHIVLVTSDIAAGIAAYRTLLGRDPAWQAAAGGAASVLFSVGNTALELIAPAGEGHAGDRVRAALAEGGERLTSLAFRVEDIAAVHRRLERRGLAPEDVADGVSVDAVSGATRRWQRTRADRHGVRLFFLQPEGAAPVSTVVADAPMTGLDHVVVTTPDPERAAALYGARLGLDMALDRTNPQWGSRLMFFRCGDLILEVMHNLKDGVGAGPDRLWGLSWRVAEIAATRARLVAAGLNVSDLRTGRKPGTQVFTVRSGTCGVPTLVLGLGAA
jgi:catechol 2,3-dioxygenase-like lactoylglutathione lyase family enzyme